MVWRHVFQGCVCVCVWNMSFHVCVGHVAYVFQVCLECCIFYVLCPGAVISIEARRSSWGQYPDLYRDEYRDGAVSSIGRRRDIAS
jgi:hypothetical protein